jgi:ribosome-associated toxin RatA of RatAB toxin-antitoxin module
LYEDFVPWNQSSRILWCKHDDDDQVFLDAKIEIGFKFFVERHISHVQLVKAIQLDQSKYPSIPFPTPPKKDPHPPSFLLLV